MRMVRKDAGPTPEEGGAASYPKAGEDRDGRLTSITSQGSLPGR